MAMVVKKKAKRKWRSMSLHCVHCRFRRKIDGELIDGSITCIVYRKYILRSRWIDCVQGYIVLIVHTTYPVQSVSKLLSNWICLNYVGIQNTLRISRRIVKDNNYSCYLWQYPLRHFLCMQVWKFFCCAIQNVLINLDVISYVNSDIIKDGF